MYPSQTSLIPTTVALIRFLEDKGVSAFFQNYPYWYLGTTPYKYLVGPMIPLVGSVLHWLLPNVSLFDITIYLIIFSILAGGIGWLFLAKEILEKNKNFIFNFLFLIFYFSFPWKYLSSLALDEGSFAFARSLVPWLLYFIYKRNLILSSLSVLIILLINTNVLPILVFGIVCLSLARSFKEGKIRKFEKGLRLTLLPLVVGFILSTFWYGPGFWWTILTNPSIGGVSGVKAIFKLFDFLKMLVPLSLAFLIVYFNSRIKNRFTVFTLSWLSSFAFLTLFRFFGDPDFWQDWTAWLPEIEAGLAFLLATLMFRRLSLLRVVAYGLIFILPFFATYNLYNLLDRPKILSREIPEGVASIKSLSRIPKNEPVFLSGATTFWTNAFHDIKQVRGGRDEVSIDPDWRKAAWEFREGISSGDSLDWAKRLNVPYVLVHTEDSQEYYHDFKNLSKWKEAWEVVWSEKGDSLYRILKL